MLLDFSQRASSGKGGETAVRVQTAKDDGGRYADIRISCSATAEELLIADLD